MHVKDKSRLIIVMLKHLVDEQHKRQQDNFHFRQPLRDGENLDYEKISRQTQRLNMTPSYRRSAQLQDGRREYVMTLEKDLSDINYGKPDLLEKAKSDPFIKQQLRLRRQNKSNTFYQKKPEQKQRFQVSERPLAKIPPIQDVQVDSDRARQEWIIQKMKMDGVERHETIPKGSKFQRVTDFYLPESVDRHLFTISHDPVQQGRVNALRTDKSVNEFPDLNSKLPIDFNIDMRLHKARNANSIEKTFLHNPRFASIGKSKTDVSCEPFIPNSLVVPTEEERKTLRNGNVDGLYIPPPFTQNLTLVEERVRETPENKTTMEDESTTSYPEFVGLQNRARQIRENKRNSNGVENEKGGIPRQRDFLQQREVTLNQNSDKLEGSFVDRNFLKTREMIEDTSRELTKQERQIDDNKALHLSVLRGHSLNSRDYKQQVGELQTEVNNIIPSSRQRLYERQRKFQDHTNDFKDSEFLQFGDFKDVKGIQQYEKRKNLPSKPEIVGPSHMSMRRIDDLMESERERILLKDEILECNGIHREDDRGLFVGYRQEREYIDPDVDQKNVFSTYRSNIEERPLPSKEEFKSESIIKSVPLSLPRERFEEKRLEKAKVGKTDVLNENCVLSKVVGLSYQEPRPIEQHKNWEMDMPGGGANTKYHILKESEPRNVSEITKSDCDHSPLNHISKLSYRNIKHGKRDLALNNQEPPEMEIPALRQSQTKRRQNTSRTNSPRLNMVSKSREQQYLSEDSKR